MEDCSWRTLGRNYLYKNPWCAFRVDEVELPGGARIEYGVFEGGGFAAVVPITDGGDVVLVRQWRQPLGTFTLELPSGRVDLGEEPERAARRELFEETGYREGANVGAPDFRTHEHGAEHGGLPPLPVRSGEGRAWPAARAHGVYPGGRVAFRGGSAHGL